MNAGRLCLALFLILLSWHFGLSMELPEVAWVGTALTVLAAFRVVNVEHPTAGLLFVLFATGALTGNQVLEDWALDDTWPQENGFGAGIAISLLLYLIWLYAADRERAPQYVINRSSQSVLVWGLMSLLLVRTSESLLFSIAEFAEKWGYALNPGADLLMPIPAMLGILLATVILLADRCGPALLRRLSLMLPLLVVMPLMMLALNYSQRPLVYALGSMMPRGGDYTQTGFSPYQTLRASVFLQPSNEPVMRIQTDALPSRYLAGNRLVGLSEDLVWLPSLRPVQSYGTLDAELLPDNQWRYELGNHHFTGNGVASTMIVHSLSGNDYLFTTPNTTHVSGRFNGISRNAADVLAPNFDRGVDARWELQSGPASGPEPENAEYLFMPEFWDDELQSHSETMAGSSRQMTADNIVSYFLARDYALNTDFDPEQPFHDFYLNDKAAYCFWFASASTLALRANGIPSRLVGGYLIHEQLSENLWLVRERDAHSWVEWQDENGYWHTIDPTPASMDLFFGGYQSSSSSQLYHRLAGQWQMFIDRLLENQAAANLITWSGLAILVFLFAREYLRIRKRREEMGDLSLRWEKLWQRFIKATQLPDQQSWTTGRYVENLPEGWSENYRAKVSEFLIAYRESRFGSEGLTAIEAVEKSFAKLLQESKASVRV